MQMAAMSVSTTYPNHGIGTPRSRELLPTLRSEVYLAPGLTASVQCGMQRLYMSDKHVVFAAAYPKLVVLPTSLTSFPANCVTAGVTAWW